MQMAIRRAHLALESGKDLPISSVSVYVPVEGPWVALHVLETLKAGIFAVSN